MTEEAGADWLPFLVGTDGKSCELAGCGIKDHLAPVSSG